MSRSIYAVQSQWEFDWNSARLREEKFEGVDAVWLTLPNVRGKAGTVQDSKVMRLEGQRKLALSLEGGLFMQTKIWR